MTLAQAKFGIDELYIHAGFSRDLLDKLHQRAAYSLDGDDAVISKYASHDMVLIFYKAVPAPGMLYRFLKFVDQDPKREDFIESNLLIDDEELYPAIKLKTYVLITPKRLHQ